MPCTSSVGAAVSATRPARSSRIGRSELQLVRGGEAACARSRRARTPCAPAADSLAHVVVEAGDLHLAGARVVHLGQQRRQLADRVARQAAGRARVHVLGAGLERDREAHQAAQPVRDRRLARRRSRSCPRRRPNRSRTARVRRRRRPRRRRRARRRSWGCRSPPPAPRGTGCWRARRSERQARAVERGQRRPLVVGRAAREPAGGAATWSRRRASA